jgi:hypothetical protein
MRRGVSGQDGLPSTSTVQVLVRDLWSQSDNGTVSASDGLMYTVPGGGASVLVKLGKPPGVA